MSSIKKSFELIDESHYKSLEEGGAGSGHYGHQGVPGERGGSTSSGGTDEFKLGDKVKVNTSSLGGVSSSESGTIVGQDGDWYSVRFDSGGQVSVKSTSFIRN